MAVGGCGWSGAGGTRCQAPQRPLLRRRPHTTTAGAAAATAATNDLVPSRESRQSHPLECDFEP